MTHQRYMVDKSMSSNDVSSPTCVSCVSPKYNLVSDLLHLATLWPTHFCRHLECFLVLLCQDWSGASFTFFSLVLSSETHDQMDWGQEIVLYIYWHVKTHGCVGSMFRLKLWELGVYRVLYCSHLKINASFSTAWTLFHLNSMCWNTQRR